MKNLRSRMAAIATALVLGSCAGSSRGIDSSGGPAPAVPARPAGSALYQPLAVNDAWTYTCRDIKGGGENGNNPFTIVHRVLGTTKVGSKTTFELELQIPQVPSTPLEIVTEVMLVANDAHGNLVIYGYLLPNESVRKIKPTIIVSNATPNKYATFNYAGPNGRLISRFFYGIEPTNPTPLGTFTVADYEESRMTHDYGYARGFGVAEEDHGPNFEVDCLVKKAKVL